jgi:hypothetical protein
VITTLPVYQAALANIQYLSAVDLNGVVWLMKGLGRPEQATEVINRYIVAHDARRERFDLDNHPFKDLVQDADIITAFNDKYNQFRDERSPASILFSIAKTHGWNDADIAILSALSPDQYYEVFKNTEGPELRQIVNTCLEFGAFGTASPSMKEITQRAQNALQRIRRESTVNALRVGTFRGA